MRSLRAVLLTSDGRRHRYAAACLGDKFELAGIVAESKPEAAPVASPLGADEAEVVRRHFTERDRVEQLLLGEPEFPVRDVLRIGQGEINSDAVRNWLWRRDPDVVLLYGTGLIRQPLLHDYKGRMINLHLGLSPYYRGSGTNFWPLVANEPECVGATIHLAVEKVDAGGILVQVRPAVRPSDRAHELGTKALQAAIEILPLAVGLYREGWLKPKEQNLNGGRLFRQRDFDAAAVRKLWRNLEEGMIPEYAANAVERMSRYPVRELSQALA